MGGDGPKNARPLVRSRLTSGSRIRTPALVAPLGRLRCRLPGERPWPVHENGPRSTPYLLQISCYLAFALAAAAVTAEGSAKAITASPSAKLWPGSPPKP